MSILPRLRIAKDLIDIFHRLPLEICRKDLTILHRQSLLGRGAHASVFEEYVIGSQQRVAYKENIITDWNRICALLRASIMCNTLLKYQVTPNVLYTYYMGYCLKYPPKFLSIQEIGGITLERFIEENKGVLDNVTAISVLIQCIMANYTLLRYFNLFNGDLNDTNILIMKVPRENYEYVINDRQYPIDNAGILVHIIDFDISAVTKREFDDIRREVDTHADNYYKEGLISILNNLISRTSLNLSGWLEELKRQPINNVDELLNNIDRHLTLPNVIGSTVSFSIGRDIIPIGEEVAYQVKEATKNNYAEYNKYEESITDCTLRLDPDHIDLIMMTNWPVMNKIRAITYHFEAYLKLK